MVVLKDCIFFSQSPIVVSAIALVFVWKNQLLIVLDSNLSILQCHGQFHVVIEFQTNQIQSWLLMNPIKLFCWYICTNKKKTKEQKQKLTNF